MLKLSLLSLALVATSQAAFAQPIVGAGGQLQQIPPQVEPQRSIPDIRVERHDTPRAEEPAGPKFQVKSLHVSGASLFPEADLIAVAGFQPGAQMDLRDLREMAARISAYYNKHGYFVAQAYLPAQDIADGAVTIVVIEGRYGKVGLNNRAHLSNGLAQSVLAGLDAGKPVETAPLERRLLLLSDMPGVDVRSTLTPGASVGTSDLVVELTPGRGITGSLEGDNAGNRYTGAYRAGGVVNFNEPFGIGDVASVRLLDSFDGLDYGRVSYQAQVQDFTVGAAFAAMHYRLGEQFSPLHADGTAYIASLYGSYPLIRSYDNNLNLVVDVDAKRFQDKIGAIASVVDKDALAVMVGITGDHHDRLWGGGWDTYSLSWTEGDLDIRTRSARVIDAGTARTNGGYGKLMFDVSRLQTVAGPLSLYGEVRGQVADKNLDISEKMELGGAYGVRAYPEGEAYGDQGYIATVEARLRLPKPFTAMPGQLQVAGFVDTGEVSTNKSPWFPGHNDEKRTGGGVSLSWAVPNNFLIKATYAHKIGDQVVTSGPNEADRFWFQIAKLF